jgi:hypothetical protein
MVLRESCMVGRYNTYYQKYAREAEGNPGNFCNL